MLAEAHDLSYLDGAFDATLGEPHARRARLRAVGDVARQTPDCWLDDVGDLPARLIGVLPTPITLRMRAVDGSAFYLSGCEAESAALRASGAIVLSVDEWDALVLATEADRAWPADLVRSLRARGSDGQLSVDALLDGVTAQQARLDAGRLFSTRNVLGRLAVRLDGAWLRDANPDLPSPEAAVP